MIKSDHWIAKQAEQGMVSPANCAANHLDGVISYGPSSYGLDLRLSPEEFLFCRRCPSYVVDPKRQTTEAMSPLTLERDGGYEYFVLPSNSYGLGVALERLHIPDNVIAICQGKSTYARAGVIVNMTPVEPGWTGHLTIGLANNSVNDCRIYANEGICQVLFLEREPCGKTYAQRNGKYQGQRERVATSKV